MEPLSLSPSPTSQTLPAPSPEVIREIAPRTLRSLFQLRIGLCVVATGLALFKVLFSPPLSKFLVDVLAEPAAAPGFSAWLQASNLVISGLLAITLALMTASFITQARVQRQVNRAVANSASESTGGSVVSSS